MLVITRAKGQGITLKGPDGLVIRLSLEDVRKSGDRARLGIEAPESIAIIRDELLGTEAEKDIASRGDAEAQREAVAASSPAGEAIPKQRLSTFQRGNRT